MVWLLVRSDYESYFYCYCLTPLWGHLLFPRLPLRFRFTDPNPVDLCRSAIPAPSRLFHQRNQTDIKVLILFKMISWHNDVRRKKKNISDFLSVHHRLPFYGINIPFFEDDAFLLRNCVFTRLIPHFYMIPCYHLSYLVNRIEAVTAILWQNKIVN